MVRESCSETQTAVTPLNSTPHCVIPNLDCPDANLMHGSSGLLVAASLRRFRLLTDRKQHRPITIQRSTAITTLTTKQANPEAG